MPTKIRNGVMQMARRRKPVSDKGLERVIERAGVDPSTAAKLRAANTAEDEPDSVGDGPSTQGRRISASF